MSRRAKAGTRVGTAHGAGVDAPSEYGFVASDFTVRDAVADSPPPGPVVLKRATSVAPSAGNARGRRDALSVIWAGLRLSLGLGVILGISVAMAYGAHRYALTSPRFAIRQFAVKGNRHHGAAELSKIAGIERGQNLFSVDTRAAEARLLENPWVRQAKVGRELPGTLRVEVVERDAVAVTTLEDSLYLVTPEGEPFKAVEPGDPSDLPIITGLTFRDLAQDRARAVERLSLGLEVLRDYEAMPLSKIYEAEEAHLVPDGSVVLTIGKKGTALYLGKGPFRQKLLMAARVIGKVQGGGELPGIVFLDNEAHPERVVVRMR
ncbi:MAG TPA: FtsQ-type POTRA domain-containing protein [Polyangiaceae bacterium]